jgi:hypothetical protein
MHMGDLNPQNQPKNKPGDCGGGAAKITEGHGIKMHPGLFLFF